MSRRLLLLLTLTLSTTWLPYQADAYVRITTPSGTPVKWTSMPITYYYNHNGFTQVPESTMVGIIQAAFDAWALSSCVKLSSSYLGKTQMVWNQSDRNNVLIWNKGIPSTQYFIDGNCENAVRAKFIRSVAMATGAENEPPAGAGNWYDMNMQLKASDQEVNAKQLYGRMAVQPNGRLAIEPSSLEI